MSVVLLQESNSLWLKVNKSIHGYQWNGWDAVATRSTQHKSPWKAISSLLDIYLAHTWYNVGDGCKVFF